MALPTESREIKDFNPAAAIALLTKFLMQQPSDDTEYGTGQQIVDLVAANIDKTDVGLGNVDNVQQQPLNALLTDIANLFGTVAKGDIIVYNGTDFVRLARGADDEVLVADVSQPTGLKWAVGGGAGVGVQLKWQYDVTTTEADPGAGKFRLNNATIASATELYISDEGANGIDAGALLNALSVNDRFYIQSGETATEALLCRITGKTDNTTWVKFTFVVEDTGSAGTWTDTKTFGVVVLFTASGGSGGHTIKDKDDAALTARTYLRFLDGLDARDNAGADATEVFLDEPPAPLAVRGVYRPTSNVSLGASSPTKIPMGTVLEASPNFVLDSGDAKCLVAGRYWVHFDLPLSSSAAWFSDVVLYKNGASYQQGGYGKQSTDIMRRAGGFMVDLEVDDTIYFQMATFPASTVTTDARMEIYEVTPRLTGVRLPERVNVDSTDGASIASGGGTPTGIVFTNIVSDSDLLYNNSTGEYTAKVDTLVLVETALRSGDYSWTTGDSVSLFVQHYTGGSWNDTLIDFDECDSGSTKRAAVQGGMPLFVRAGDKFRIGVQHDRTGGAISFETGPTCWMRATALPTVIPQPDIPAERVICKVGIAGTQGIAHDSEEKVLLDTAIKDPKGWFNAGSNRIDIKADGTYDFFGQLSCVDGSINQNWTETQLRLLKNGSVTVALFREGWDTSGYSGRYGRIEAREIDLVAGDYLEVQVYIWDPSGTTDRNINTAQSVTWFMLAESIGNMAIRGAGVGTVLNAPVRVWPNNTLNLPGSWSAIHLDFRGLYGGNDDGAWDLSDGYYKPKYDGWMIASIAFPVQSNVYFAQDGYRLFVQSSDDGGSTWTAGEQLLAYGQPYSPTNTRWAFLGATGPWYARKDRWYRFMLAKEGTAGGPISNTTESVLSVVPLMTGRSTAHLPTWIPFTPTVGGWTSGMGTITGRYKDLGDELDIEVYIPITGGITPTLTDLLIDLPSGFVLDPFTPTDSFGRAVFGQIAVDTGVGTVAGGIYLDAGATTHVKPTFWDDLGAYVSNKSMQHNAPVTFASGDSIHARFKVPVKRA